MGFEYMPAEAFRGKNLEQRCTRKRDIWAGMMTLLAMLTGQPPLLPKYMHHSHHTPAGCTLSPDQWNRHFIVWNEEDISKCPKCKSLRKKEMINIIVDSERLKRMTQLDYFNLTSEHLGCSGEQFAALQ